ncbi:MAG TPA: DUF2235 domain-containing protein [Caldimonas sp.]|nr:DUF2235 domain-containing protein [Caldimonas sp.]
MGVAVVAKNIAVFLDGTRNRLRRDKETNVAKLFRASPELDKPGRRQVKRYLHGVGTRPPWFERLTRSDPLRRDIRKHLKPEVPRGLGPLRALLGTAYGAGTEARIKEAYLFICGEYDAERRDKVFVFGFSRGAFAARSLAGFIDRVGLLLYAHAGHVEEAYALYESCADASQSALAEFLVKLTDRSFPGPESRDYVRIHFLGVWDTVAALGVPWSDSWTAPHTRYVQLEVPPNVMNARHALALHELRSDFEALAWCNRSRHPSLQQVWFVGAHADVGGGYRRTESGLSDIALRWMAVEAEAAGLVVERSAGWWQPVPEPLSLHHEVRGPFAGIEPAVRAHVAGTHPLFDASLDSFRFHAHVLRHFDDATARDYREPSKVSDALRAVDECALRLYLRTRLVGNDIVSSAS